MDKVISLAKRRGFVFQGSDIYGGLANTWDYGPVGVELKNNIKKLWWQTFVKKRADVVGLDSAILMNPAVWAASGHLGGFTDPLIDCRNCKNRFRADKLLSEYFIANNLDVQVEGQSAEFLSAQIDKYKIACPNCKSTDFTEIRQFNLMFKTFQGVTESRQDTIYLRPETAQGIFVNFKNIATTSRLKIPFGTAQIGKAFRNEISPGNFIFRTREFEQMELEYFCHPQQAMDCFEKWQHACRDWLYEIGLRKDLLRLRKHEASELSHYSQATTDIEFRFPFGWGELWGIAHRGSYDLEQHQQASGKDLTYFDASSNEKFLPNVIEPSVGVDRLLLAIMLSAYHEDEIDGQTRVLLKFSPKLAPIQVGLLALSKKLLPLTNKLYPQLVERFSVEADETGSIGKRYRRFDELGTPFCVTVDFQTAEDNCVTVRERDTTKQERVAIDQLITYLQAKIENE